MEHSSYIYQWFSHGFPHVFSVRPGIKLFHLNLLEVELRVVDPRYWLWINTCKYHL